MTLSITLIFIIVAVIASIKGFSDSEFLNKYVNWPYRVQQYKEYYRMLSSGFVHADYLHLIINAFVLYQFGLLVEAQYSEIFGSAGRIWYILLLLLGIAIPDYITFLNQKDNSQYRSLGASGAVSAVLFAYVLFNPWSKLYIYGILPLYSIIAAVLYLIYSIWADRRGGDNVNHMAHISGAAFGFLYTIALKPSLLSDFINNILNFQI